MKDSRQDYAIDIQGHRGCRGLMPENTLPAFRRAMELGVTTLEMDLVISADKQVVVSHEPFFRYPISRDPNGEAIPKNREKEYNLYSMPYDSIRLYDVGSSPDPNHPKRSNIQAYKPLFSEVVEQSLKISREIQQDPPRFNIEIKRVPEQDGIYHPSVDEFVDLVLEQVRKLGVEDHTIIQSFDLESLQLTRQKAPGLALALLIMNRKSPQENIVQLGFKPDVYSPYFELVNKELIDYCRKQSCLVIPWTVNEERDILRMIELGVDGIISDYPDRVIKLLN